MVLKKKLILHVGFGKTGTTSLQNFFWSNRKQLLNNGILYPEYGAVAGAHHRLSPHIPPFLKDVWGFYPAPEWAQRLHAMSDSTILLSSEIISSASPEVVAKFAVDLERYFDMTLVFYVRRQDNLMIAAYNQQIKAGTQTLDIRSALPNLFITFDFQKRLAPWLTAFGEQNIVIRPYERQQFLHGDIRKDFLSTLLGIGSFNEFSFDDKNENPRLTYSAMEFKRHINNVIKDTQISNKYNDFLLQYSARKDESSTSIFHESDLLAGIERKMILNRYGEVNRWIATHLMGRRDGILFYDKEPQLDRTWAPPEVDRGAFSEIGADMWAARLGDDLVSTIKAALAANRFEGYRSALLLGEALGFDVNNHCGSI